MLLLRTLNSQRKRARREESNRGGTKEEGEGRTKEKESGSKGREGKERWKEATLQDQMVSLVNSNKHVMEIKMTPILHSFR